MSLPNLPGFDRLRELYDLGCTAHGIALDPYIGETILKGIENPNTRRWEIHHLLKVLKRLEVFPTGGQVVEDFAPSHAHTITPQKEATFAHHLEQYEKFIGAHYKRRENDQKFRVADEKIVVISDTHAPDERRDLITQICIENKGRRCVLAGDINDFAAYGRWDVTDWTLGNLKDALAYTDAMLDLMGQYFPQIDILFGNHDLRLPRKAGKQLGPDYFWLTQEFLMYAYEKRHGVKVIHRTLDKKNGRQIPGIFFYHQVGDAMIGHVEVGGKPTGKGALMAHDFFYSWKHELGLNPFNVVLQAHTHKQSYFRHPLTRVHCYEIGALCDTPAYAVMQGKYAPPNHGYFLLSQRDGVTDINESRLVSLD
jgi:predicted phosphodiesterase